MMIGSCDLRRPRYATIHSTSCDHHRINVKGKKKTEMRSVSMVLVRYDVTHKGRCTKCGRMVIWAEKWYDELSSNGNAQSLTVYILCLWIARVFNSAVARIIVCLLGANNYHIHIFLHFCCVLAGLGSGYVRLSYLHNMYLM